MRVRISPKAAVIASAALLMSAQGSALAAPAETAGASAAYTAPFEAAIPAPDVGEIDAKALAPKGGESRWLGPLALIAGFLAGALSWRHLKSAFRSLGPAAAEAARIVAAAPKAAAAAVGRIAAAPARWLLAMVSLVVFSLFGFSAFDLEWLAGAAAGIAGALMVSISAVRLRRAASAVLAGFAGAGR